LILLLQDSQTCRHISVEKVATTTVNRDCEELTYQVKDSCRRLDLPALSLCKCAKCGIDTPINQLLGLWHFVFVRLLAAASHHNKITVRYLEIQLHSFVALS
jgi:hypothetical protein